MNLVEIQVVCAQAFQGSFNLLMDGFLGETTFIEINLGCDNHVLSLLMPRFLSDVPKYCSLVP